VVVDWFNFVPPLVLELKNFGSKFIESKEGHNIWQLCCISPQNAIGDIPSGSIILVK